MNTRTRLHLAVTAALLSATLASPAIAAEPERNSDPATELSFARQSVSAPAVIANPNVKITFTAPDVASTPSVDTQLQMALQSTSFSRIGGLLSHPVPQSVLTSPFAYRVSPITGQTDEFHTGQDFGSPCGTDVTAAADGTVVFAGWHAGGGGNRVEVDHGNGLKTTYNHLSGYHADVGQSVTRGQSIANVGTTGSSTGCHLHFEVWQNGTVTDPLPWL